MTHACRKSRLRTPTFATWLLVIGWSVSHSAGQPASGATPPGEPECPWRQRQPRQRPSCQGGAWTGDSRCSGFIKILRPSKGGGRDRHVPDQDSGFGSGACRILQTSRQLEIFLDSGSLKGQVYQKPGFLGVQTILPNSWRSSTHPAKVLEEFKFKMSPSYVC